MARARDVFGVSTRLLRRFPVSSSCGCSRRGGFEWVMPNHLAAESELRAPALARGSKRHAGEDRPERGFPNPQLARARDVSGTGPRHFRRFPVSSSCGCSRRGGFERVRPNHLAAESELRAPALARGSKPQAAAEVGNDRPADRCIRALNLKSPGRSRRGGSWNALQGRRCRQPFG